jgi:hypothetical protein
MSACLIGHLVKRANSLFERGLLPVSRPVRTNLTTTNELSGGCQPLFLRTLAAAYAETERFPEAVEAAQKALGLAQSQGDTILAQTIKSNLSLYQRDLPLRIPRR